MQLRPYQKNLINRTRESFFHYKKPLVVLPCGAGKTVCFADMASKHIEKSPDNFVWFLVHRQELVDQTTETFKEQGIDTTNIFIGMVQTVTRNIGKYPKPSMIIFDEAHHATAKTWSNIAGYYDIPIIGLTATPCRLDGSGLGNIFDTIIEGESTEWLINNNYLAQYDYYAPKIDINFNRKGKDFDQEDIAAQFESKKIYGDIMSYIDTNKKTIIYCPTIEYSKELAERIPGAVHFDGDTPHKLRQHIVSQFKKGHIRTLLNVDLIGEGFDVPDCDCVMLLRPTMSLSLYIQQSMRALRPGKRATIYDFVGNVYRHGMPCEKRLWTLTDRLKVNNPTGEPDILSRQCKKCYRVYAGISKICPYCGNENGLTRKQIQEQTEIELEKIKQIEKRQVGRARDYASLVEIGYDRGYKNPEYWARCIINARRGRV